MIVDGKSRVPMMFRVNTRRELHEGTPEERDLLWTEHLLEHGGSPESDRRMENGLLPEGVALHIKAVKGSIAFCEEDGSLWTNTSGGTRWSEI